MDSRTASVGNGTKTSIYKKQLCNRIHEFNAINHTRVVNGPTRSDPNPKLQARTRPEPENNLKL